MLLDAGFANDAGDSHQRIPFTAIPTPQKSKTLSSLSRRVSWKKRFLQVEQTRHLGRSITRSMSRIDPIAWKSLLLHLPSDLIPA